MELLVRNKPGFFDNKDFKTIQIKVMFPFRKSINDYAMMQILPGLLHLYTKKYPTEKEFSMVLDKNYVLACFCIAGTIGDLSYLSFNMSIPDTYAIKEDLLDKQFELFSEMIYDPLTDGNKFLEDNLKREVEGLKVNIEKMLKDTVSYALIEGKKEIDDEGILSDSIYNHMDEIDLVNTSNIYDFYKDKVLNNNPIIYVFGNYDKKKITNLCNKYIYKNKFNDYKIKYNIKYYLKPRNDFNNVTKKSDFRNSIMSVYYKVRDMKDEDEMYINAIKELLSSPSSRLLNKKLRDENEFVYSSFVVNYNSFGILGILASINKGNEKEVVKKIKEVINDLKNEEMVDTLLKSILERRKIGLLRILDDKSALFTDAIVDDIGFDLTSYKYYEALSKITAHDISLFVDRLVLDTVYFLKEGDHE